MGTEQTFLVGQMGGISWCPDVARFCGYGGGFSCEYDGVIPSVVIACEYGGGIP